MLPDAPDEYSWVIYLRMISLMTQPLSVYLKSQNSLYASPWLLLIQSCKWSHEAINRLKTYECWLRPPYVAGQLFFFFFKSVHSNQELRLLQRLRAIPYLLPEVLKCHLLKRSLTFLNPGLFVTHPEWTNQTDWPVVLREMFMGGWQTTLLCITATNWTGVHNVDVNYK